jgi:transcriptional regulator with XRE-family HTH domain
MIGVAVPMPTKAKRGRVEIDRAQLQPDRSTQFQPGNRTAAKTNWSPKQVLRFQKQLRTLREWLGFTYEELGHELGCSGTYVKLLEGGYASAPLRQPSDKILKSIAELEKVAAPKNKFRPSRRVRSRAQDLWTHILVRKFKCPECAREVRHGEREPGLEYWWHPTRKHCPEHSQPRRKGKR